MNSLKMLILAANPNNTGIDLLRMDVEVWRIEDVFATAFYDALGVKSNHEEEAKIGDNEIAREGRSKCSTPVKQWISGVLTLTAPKTQVANLLTAWVGNA